MLEGGIIATAYVVSCRDENNDDDDDDYDDCDDDDDAWCSSS